MNGPEADDSPRRPLTRRELRAAAGAEAAGLDPSGPGGPVAEVETARPETVAETAEPETAEPETAEPETAGPETAGPETADAEAGDQPGEVGGAPEPPNPWDQAVRWSLRHELPRELPPEPDVDDVRWEPVMAISPDVDPDRTTGSRPDGGAGQDDGTNDGADGVAEGSGGRSEVEPSDGVAGDHEQTTPPTSVVPTQPHSPFPPVGSSEPEPEPEPGSWAADGASNGVPHGEVAAPPPQELDGGAAYRPRQVLSPTDGNSPRPGPPVPEPSDRAPGKTAGAPVRTSFRPGAEDDAPLPAPVPPPEAGPGALPTLDDLIAGRPMPSKGPAQSGWQGVLRRFTGGLVSPGPGRREQGLRMAVATTQTSLDGPRTIVVINPKGGAHKTTATLMLAATFGLHRGGYTLAWDNNETRGTLGWRSVPARHHRTAVNLLQDLDRFVDPGTGRVGDLDNYVRSQGSAQFDVLASDEDAASAASIDAFAFRSLHRTLSRFYRIMVIDTGNNMRASNWQAAIEAADQVVLVSTVREDTAHSAAWAVDALRATGHEGLVERAVTVLSAPDSTHDERLASRLHEHFGKLTRVVVDVPYDPSLVAGRPIEFDRLSRATREAWLRVSAAVAEGL